MFKDITEFGGDPTGVLCVAGAVEASIAAQGRAIFPSHPDGFTGTPAFRFNRAAEINSPCTIEGPGSRRIGSGPAACTLIIRDDYADMFHINADNVTMRGLCMEGTGVRAQNAGRGKAVVVGVTVPVENFRMLDCYIASHSIGVAMYNASNFWIERNTIHSHYSVLIENRANGDKGDATMRGNEFFSTRVYGSRCVFYRSGGSLKCSGNKYLDAYDAFVVAFDSYSGGPVLNGEHIENFVRNGVYAHGNGSTPMHGMHVQNCWINGGTRSIMIANNAVINKLIVTGNILTGGPNPGITVGSAVTNPLVANNIIV